MTIKVTDLNGTEHKIEIADTNDILFESNIGFKSLDCVDLSDKYITASDDESMYKFMKEIIKEYVYTPYDLYNEEELEEALKFIKD